MTLGKRKAELQTLLMLISTLWKQGKMSGGCLGNFFVATRSCPEHTCMYRKKSSVPIPSTFIDVVRETKNQSGEFGRENSVDDFWNIDEDRTHSESWIGSTRFFMLNKGPPQGDAWVNGRLTRTQVTSSPETSRPEVWSSMPKCAQRKHSSNGILKDPKYKLHARRGNVTMFLLTKLKNSTL